MKKSTKLFIAIFGIIAGLSLIGGSIFMAYQNSNNLNNTIPNFKGQMNDSNPETNGTTDGMHRGRPNADSSNQNSDTTEDSTSTDTTTSDSTTKPTRPDMNGDSSMQRPSMDNQNINSSMINNQMKPSYGFTTLNIVLIVLGSTLASISVLYLIYSKFGTINAFRSIDNIIIIILVTIIASGIISFGAVTLSNKYLFSNNPTLNNQNMTTPTTSDNTTNTIES